MSSKLKQLLDKWWNTEPFGFDHPDTYNGILQLMQDSQKQMYNIIRRFKVMNCTRSEQNIIRKLEFHLKKNGAILPEIRDDVE